MALALYRKYRPATFAEVVGQEHVTQPLRTALAAGRINHAYLFSGPRGCGKTSSARIMARSLNCVQGPTPDPCGVCPSCVALAPEGPGSLDVVELDAASHGGVDDTRDLRDRAFYMPAESRYRVFIIDEAHMVSAQGFNALLKIVEEPPEHLVFIFATTEPEKVIATIRSRTHHYPFRLIPPATLRRLLEKLCGQEDVRVEPAVFPLVIRAGGGSARDSLSILDQLLAGAGPDGVTYRDAVALLGVTDAALLDEMVDAIAAGDGASVFGAVDKVVEAGHDPRRFAADLLQRFRDLVIIAAVPDAGAKGIIDAPEDQIAAMYGQSERLGAGTLTRLAEVLHTGLTDMRGTTSPRLALELMCARMLLPSTSSSEGALVQRVERIEKALTGLGPSPMAGGPPAGVAEIAAKSVAPAAEPARQVDADGPGRSRSAYRRPSSRSPSAAPIPSVATVAAAKPGLTADPPDAETSVPATSVPAASDEAASAPAKPPSPSVSAATAALGMPAPPVLSQAIQRPAPPRTKAADPARSSAEPGSAVPAVPATVAVDSADWVPPDAPPDEDEYGDPVPAGQQQRRDALASSPAPPTAVAAVPSKLNPAKPNPGKSAIPQKPNPAKSPVVEKSTAAPDGPKLVVATPATTPLGASAGSAPDLGVTDVRRLWPEILTAVQRKRRTTQILLESATVVDVLAGVLYLTMPSAGVARRVVEPANAELLRQSLKEVMGVEWAIRCQPAGEAPPARPSLTLVPSSPDPVAEPVDDDVPDEYDVQAKDPHSGHFTPRDLEEVAIELLTQELGAERIDP